MAANPVVPIWSGEVRAPEEAFPQASDNRPLWFLGTLILLILLIIPE